MIEDAMEKRDCIFCKIAAGELPADVVYQDELVSAFRDINPVAPTHILIIPNQHVQDSNMLGEEHKDVAAQMLLVVSDIAKSEGIDQSGYRLIMNTGPDGNQEVMHMHLHLIGGQKMKHAMG
jgi:histidine triad (HIT) family protein